MTRLLGTEKQITWATEIRENALNGISTARIFGLNQTVAKAEKKIAKNQIEKKSHKKAIITLRIAKEYISKINEIDCAEWFINNRNKLSNIDSVCVMEANSEFHNEPLTDNPAYYQYTRKL